MKTSVRRSQGHGALTEELVCMRLRWFCWTGAAEDGRAPTEELSCVRFTCFCSMGRPWFGSILDRVPLPDSTFYKVGVWALADEPLP